MSPYTLISYVNLINGIATHLVTSDCCELITFLLLRFLIIYFARNKNGRNVPTFAERSGNASPPQRNEKTGNTVSFAVQFCTSTYGDLIF